MNWSSLVEKIREISTVLGLITLIFGVFGGIYGFWLWLKKHWLAPRLVINLPSKSELHETRHTKGGQAYEWARLSVTHKSRYIVWDASAYLTKVQKFGDSGEVEAKNLINSRIPMLWLPNLDRKTDLLSRVPSFLSLYWFKWDSGILAFGSDGEGRQEVYVQVPGRYLARVECVAPNSKSASIVLLIEAEDKVARPSITLWSQKLK